MKSTLPFIFFCVVFSFFLDINAIAKQDTGTDLRSDWLIYKEGAYQPVTDEIDSKVIYLQINSWKFPNTRLQIKSPDSFYVFLNGLLSTQKSRQVTFSIDSLREALGTASILVAVYQQNGVSTKRLNTMMIMDRDPGTGPVIVDRAPTYFHDFVVLGVFIVLIFLILIVAQNPKLAADYFSLRKLFAAPGTQDGLSDTRTTSSSNILFQTFCSVLGGFLLTILFNNLKEEVGLATLIVHANLGEALLTWLFLSLIILVAFFVKQIVIYLFAYLFGIRELAVAHYFNLIRLLFWVLGLSAMVVSIYLVVHGKSVRMFENVYNLIGWGLGFWVFLIFFKLSRRVGFSMFHLFSYLCATEIIPLIITIKVLYY